MGDKSKVTALRLRHPDLAFYVDVTLTEHAPDIGTGHHPREALRASLAALGEPYASEMDASA